jgi:hypothetical protein
VHAAINTYSKYSDALHYHRRRRKGGVTGEGATGDAHYARSGEAIWNSILGVYPTEAHHARSGATICSSILGICSTSANNPYPGVVGACCERNTALELDGPTGCVPSPANDAGAFASGE